MLDYWSCLRTFFIAHRKPLMLWGLSQIPLLILFRLFWRDSFDQGNVFTVFAIFIAYAASFYALVVYVALNLPD